MSSYQIEPKNASHNATFIIFTLLTITTIIIMLYNYWLLYHDISYIQTNSKESNSKESNSKETYTSEPLPRENIQQKPKEKVKFVIYHMKGCIHCHNIMDPRNGQKSIYDQLVDQFKDNNDVIIQHHHENIPNDIRAFPTIRIIKGGVVREYNGQRDVASMANAIKEALQ